MRAIFLDTQDDANPNNGLPVDDATELARLIAELRTRRPFFFMLKTDAGPTLLVGLGPKVGCAQFTDERGIATMAVAPGPAGEAGFVDFVTANTPTPVPTRYCMRLPLIEKIAGRFIERGDRNPDFAWETV